MMLIWGCVGSKRRIVEKSTIGVFEQVSNWFENSLLQFLMMFSPGIVIDATFTGYPRADYGCSGPAKPIY